MKIKNIKYLLLLIIVSFFVLIFTRVIEWFLFKDVYMILASIAQFIIVMFITRMFEVKDSE